ncbi:MAG TPA: acetamidase/formamidase family protein, partial [Tissierellaceae bacterium]|nr:acetamidase/formamidase family protein [Tissierellaceae bacterium]
MKKLHTDNLNYKFSKEIKPLLKIKSGERVKIDTLDCYNELLIDGKTRRSEIDSNKINPISGPIYIDKAYPGDILEIKIEDIEVKDRGVMTSKPGMGLLGNKVELEDSKLIKIKEGKLIFSEDIKLDIDPMI